MNPSDLPFELQVETLLQLTPEEILNYCQVNQTARKICQSNYFWNQKAEHDFGISAQMIFNLSSYEQYRLMQTLEESIGAVKLLIRSNQFEKADMLLRLVYGVGTLFHEATTTSDFELLNFLKPYIQESIDTHVKWADSYESMVKTAFRSGNTLIVDYILSFKPQIMQDQAFLTELRHDLQVRQSTAGLALLKDYHQR